MFERYFAQYQPRPEINPSCVQSIKDALEKRISKYLAFDKEKLLTDIAERINAENMNVPVDHLPNLKILQAMVIDKGVIRFNIQLDPVLNSAIRPLCYILGNFFCVKKEEELRYEMSPYIPHMEIYSSRSPRFEKNPQQVLQQSIGMPGHDQLWIFDVTKLDMVN